MPIEPSAVTSRGALVAFILALRDEHRADPEAWENNDLSRFLDSLALGSTTRQATGPISGDLNLGSQTGHGWLSHCEPRRNTSDCRKPFSGRSPGSGNLAPLLLDDSAVLSGRGRSSPRLASS